ncbi:LysM peptidoglycan-binding domain-containing protein [Hymenobacter sp. H14-R3]|uniref:LysM peptidoglycan-binding domain-containing protein n=1 Tax=Hymenobacter sp. H14-R3 TaxID=3046308 RepID=UPI0024BB86B5|nr:LysM peptidoglycan-binding domain-containing protein [Hymenobacter sp. H14-R3]MDJ0364080.1 LysM peptidoglycan-binding domain-containing protein [Hymenobacter sp. H14-R3]
MSLLASFLILNSLHGPLATPPAGHRLPADSIGQEMRNGQRFVRHRVAQGETMFALSRRYKVTVDQITAANPQLKSGLGIGEVVLIPRPAGRASAAAAAVTPAKTMAAIAPAAAAPATTTVPDRYTVAKGETLFGIARRFNLSPAELLLLNHLPSGGSVRVGQELLLRAAEAGAAPVAATPVAAARPAASDTPASTPKINPTAPAQIATVTAATPAEKREEAAETRSPTRASELVARKTDVGIASAIGNSGTDKYLALHKTAPVGTIMQVKNQMNGQSVYVRVIGTLPDTGENDNILVRLSPRAVQKLGTTDAKFRVETSYVP